MRVTLAITPIVVAEEEHPVLKLNEVLVLSALSLSLAACGGTADEPEAATEEVAAIPEDLAPFGDGYPNAGDACRRLGESPATSNFLDDSAMLVGCPTEASAETLDGEIVGNINGVRLVSISMGDANAGMPQMASPVAPPADPIRGPGGMEERCLDRVNDTVGGGVIGTNRIEEAESGVMIYVNVQGAAAPWQCFGSRDGTISEVFFGGDEGAL